MKKVLTLILLNLALLGSVHSQSFPNPVTLSTGQGTPGSLDPIWEVSPWYTSSPPNPMGLAYIPGLINNNCAPGSWVDPSALPPPVNNGNWITGSDGSCANNPLWGYRYFRLTLNLPAECNGNSITTSGTYELNFVGYVDNTITDVFVNGTSTGISGGGFSAGSQLSISLVGPWVAGINYIDVLVLNYSGGSNNPYGLLLVADDVANASTDTDNDGISNLDDQCACDPGSLVGGCPASIVGDTIICEGESIALSATGTGAYMWNTGATTSSIMVNPTVSTSYDVIVTTSSGYEDTAFIDVTVKPLPAISITGNTSICPGDTTTLSASGGGTYSWNTGSANSSIVVGPLSTTSYNVTVTSVGCVDSATISVDVNPIPVAMFTNTTVCQGNTTSFTDASTISSGAIISWAWDFGTGTSTSTIQNPSQLYDTAGIYTVTLAIASDFGCFDTVTQNIELYPNPIAEFAFQSGCLGTTASFTDNSTIVNSGSITSWAWDFGDLSAIDPLQNPQYIYSSVGDYDVTLTVTTDDGCTDDTIMQVPVYPLPQAGFIGTNVCFNKAPTQFTDTSQIQGDIVTMWNWDFGDAGISTSQNPSHTYSASGTYSVELVVTSSNGCNDMVMGQVEVYAVPQIGFSSDFTSGCLPLCVNFNNTTTVVNDVIGNWSWDFGDGDLSNDHQPPKCYDQDGVYSVTLEATSSNGCTNSMTLNNLIEVWPNPVADFLTNPEPTTVLNTQVLFTDNSIGLIDQWNWSFYYLDSVTLLGADTISPNPAFDFPIDTGKYPVHLEVTTINGCTDDTLLYVTILQDYVLYTPSVFTPNGDGMNDLFFPTGVGVEGDNVDMYIINRWGDIIYRTNSATTPWDGTANNGSSLAQEDVYVWLFYTTDHMQKKHQYVGHVTLIR